MIAPEELGQDAGGFIHGNVPQNLHRPIEKAIADGGDDDVANAAVIDAGDLLLRNVDHKSIRSKEVSWLLKGEL